MRWCSPSTAIARRRAAGRALEACLPHVADNKTIRFLFLPSEHDPDSYVREEGTEAFAAQVRDAMPLSRFLLQVVTEEQDLRQPEGRAGPSTKPAAAAGHAGRRPAAADRA